MPLPTRSLLLLSLLAAAVPMGGPARGAEPEGPGPSPPAATPGPASPATPVAGPEDGKLEADTAPVPPPGPGDEEDDDPSLYEGWATPQELSPPPPRREPVTLLFDLGAYYTSAGLYLPLTGTPTPDAGERSEAQLYWSLLSGALVPRFLVVEASVNPMPCLGLLAHQWDWGYQRAQVTRNLNLVKTLTAGFDEPFAVSLFVGNVADFDLRGRRDVRGRGYLGLVASGGLGHIKANVLVEDRWLEAELKLKGNRVSEEAKLAWSFRVGLKAHDNPDITDTAYLGLRRSRVDYQDDSLLLANSGAELRFDVSLDGKPVRLLAVVDKKWPLGKGRVALVLGVGVLVESGDAYRGALAERHSARPQFLVRPNVVF